MTIAGGVILAVLAVVVVTVDWFLAAPAFGAPKWPRWVKLFCAVVIALVGLGTIFAGYVARFQGIEAYRDGDYRVAIEKLETTVKSPFKNRAALDYLALAWKKQAEIATIPLVKERNFLTSINLMVRSINEYPCSPRAHNNLVNVFRRTGKWAEGKEAINQLINKLEGGYFSTCDPPVPKKEFAVYYVTLGNFYVDDENPDYSIVNAMKFYDKAARLNENNRFLILNVPPRLMQLAETATDPKQRRAFIQRAYDLSKPALRLREHEDRAFAMINIIDALAEKVSPPLTGVEHDLKKLVRDVETRIHSVNLDDETWLVLAKGNLALCDKEAAKRNLSLARAEVLNYTKRQKATLAKLEYSLSQGKCGE